MISLNLFITIVGILITIILFLVGYIIHTWKRESVLSAKNDSLAIERTKFDKETDKLKNEIVTLKKEKSKPTSKRSIGDKYVFIDKYGIYKSKENEHYFCASCIGKDIESPMRTEEFGWKCMSKDCLAFFPNEKYKPPKRRRMLNKGIDIDDI